MPNKEEKIDFEKNLKELENIVQELERGDLSLDDSMKKFEQGVNLSRTCSQQLEEAEKKITILIEKDGQITQEIF